MKKSLILMALLNPFSSYGLSVDEAFQKYYNDPSLNARHCGRNIQGFLNYISENRVTFKKGYVVSFHNDYGFLYHYRARWGTEEKYLNGISFSSSAYHFHVFAVIDNKAYDFSSAGSEAESLNDYLRSAYLPKHPVKLFGTGQIDTSGGLRILAGTEMRLYRIEEYRNPSSSAFYSGDAFELLSKDSLRLGPPVTTERAVDKIPMKWDLGAFSGRIQGDHQRYLQAEKINRNTDGTVTITRPRVNTDQGLLPLAANEAEVCKAFGFPGVVEGSLEISNTNNEKMAKLLTSPGKFDFSKSFCSELIAEKGRGPSLPEYLVNGSTSLKIHETGTGAAIIRHFQYVEKVTCSDLKAALNRV